MSLESRVCWLMLLSMLYGQVRVRNGLRKCGTFVSLSGVGSIWLRHELAAFNQRLHALKKHAAS